MQLNESKCKSRIKADASFEIRILLIVVHFGKNVSSTIVELMSFSSTVSVKTLILTLVH
jgi:hypothetical protein